jgi:hypothetical protein
MEFRRQHKALGLKQQLTSALFFFVSLVSEVGVLHRRLSAFIGG